MSIALDFFCFAVPFTMIFATVLSVSTVVGGCEWPIYSRSVCMDVAFWKLSNNITGYASVAYAMTFLIVLNYTCTGPFSEGIYFISVLGFCPRKKYPPALLSASGSEM